MKKLKYPLLFLILLFCDQITKVIAKNNLEGKEAVILIKNIFEFRYLEGGNTGAAFGILQGKTWILALLSLIVFIAIVYFFFKIPKEKKYIPLQFTLCVLAAGAMGNFIDRAFRKYVIDFIYVKAIDFPIFNVADCYVTVSAVALFLLLLFIYKDEDLQFIGKSNKQSTN